MDYVKERSKRIAVVEEVDVCVLGGSCTGVFAAIRAARLGAKTAIIESQNCFGGVATTGMVCIWHTLYDTHFNEKIISGLTEELVSRLKKRKNAVVEYLHSEGPARMDTLTQFRINTEELKFELDEMILEAGITPYLHTFYSAPHMEDGVLKAVLIENKSGRSAIKAKVFIDATADGDLCMHLGAESHKADELQPASVAARVYDNRKRDEIDATIHAHLDECGMKDIGWTGHPIPGADNVTLWMKPKMCYDCSDGKQLTLAEIEGRRQIRAMMDVVRKHMEGGEDITVLALASRVGIRETRQIKCKYRITFEDIINGERFDDAVVNCCYPPDIHHRDTPGTTYYYLDGVTVSSSFEEPIPIERRWREAKNAPTFWQIPYRCLVPEVPLKLNNVLVCGRAIDADKKAFGAIRVMISTNQTGEAAGVAAYLAATSKLSVEKMDTQLLRETMKNGGSIVI